MSPNEPAPRLIDPATGTATLRLYPYYLKRLHGERAEVTEAGGGLPFPFLANVPPRTVTLHGGIRKSAPPAADCFERRGHQGDRSWWDWQAYAYTPFGWIPFAMVHFMGDRITGLTLNPRGFDTPDGFLQAEAILIDELGLPHRKQEDSPDPRISGIFRNNPWQSWGRTWTYPWGQVQLYFEGRDQSLEVAIRWT